MKVIGVIPARMASSRFPGKPLAPIFGKSMLEHVYKRSALCRALDDLAVATPDQEIARAVTAFGGKALMTSASHQRATDRVSEAALTLKGDIVIVIQGDEPLLHPEMIEAAVRPVIDDADIFCTNLVERIHSVEEFVNPNTIKVTMAQNGDALYFSRAAIPTMSRVGFDGIHAYKQVCVLPFRRDNLFKFNELLPTSLEECESIDMLRVLEHGYRVRLVETPFRTQAVDAPEDILLVERLMVTDPLVSRY